MEEDSGPPRVEDFVDEEVAEVPLEGGVVAEALEAEGVAEVLEEGGRS